MWHIVLAIFLLMLAACATITDGVNQKVTIKTPPVTGAACDLKNNKGHWKVTKTPATLTIRQDSGDLLVSCYKSGYQSTSKKFKSSTKAKFFGNALMIGGTIGAGIDIANGAAFKYPDVLLVPMQK